MKLSTAVLFIILFSLADFATAQNSLLQNVFSRKTTSLNGKWNYIIDPYEMGYYDNRYIPYDQNPKTPDRAYYANAKPKSKSDRIEYDFDKSPVLTVPRDWNSQVEKLFYYEGTIWYKKSFDYPSLQQGNRLFIYFGAVNYRADVYLNGEKLGFHKGGFTPFQFEITGKIREKDNFIIVKVDNKRRAEEVPTLNTDWWNYGGITRDVLLVELPPTYIADYSLQLDRNNKNLLKGYVKLEGDRKDSEQIQIQISELKATINVKTDIAGLAHVETAVKDIRCWEPEDPFLYSVSISTGSDHVQDKIGFRTIETTGPDILLNGKSVFLRGISIHEENPVRGGRAYSMEDARLLLGWARELGCNFVRLAHYPHNENMNRLADEMGILVWEENPVYWTIQWNNPETFVTASNQLKEMLSRDKNRASVIIWSMANETPVTQERLVFLTRLADTARWYDNSRLISAALEQHAREGSEETRVIEDPFAGKVDVVSFNEYIGWYDGLPSKCSRIKWEIPFNKPVIVSEFGGDALEGFHGDSLTRWSEEYQEYLYKENLKMISGITQLRGMTPWILADFRSPRRNLPVMQDGWNRKGLVSENGKKKKAFTVLQKYYLDLSSKMERKR